ncbi:hypothetical protein GCM10009661_26370 [Catellatospora chokoriensis]|uniref:Uncharacterized protein n=1 Tax=Catellatospora chokoriensis TaxID=310353 RepID=A0A8J3NPQ5_9ACTN|nr:hypothetical protein Cch02nite_11600 [Catellatospora chokoriensis]
MASAELPAKLKITFVPGLAASNSLPSLVNDSVSDAAANTVTSPLTPVPETLAPGWAVPSPPHAAVVSVAAISRPASADRINLLFMNRSSPCPKAHIGFLDDHSLRGLAEP